MVWLCDTCVFALVTTVSLLSQCMCIYCRCLYCRCVPIVYGGAPMLSRQNYGQTNGNVPAPLTTGRETRKTKIYQKNYNWQFYNSARLKFFITALPILMLLYHFL